MIRVAIFALMSVLAVRFWIGVASAHDPYTKWQRPDTVGSCCNKRTETSGDCEPTRAYFDGKKWHALFQGQYIEVPPEKVLRFPSHDGQAHLCAVPGTIYCFMPPEARF